MPKRLVIALAMISSPLVGCGDTEMTDDDREAMRGDEDSAEAAATAEDIPPPPATVFVPEDGGDGNARQGFGTTGTPLPNVHPMFDDIAYVHQPVEGEYAGHALVVLGRDSEERNTVKIVDKQALQVTSSFQVCCAEQGHPFAIDRIKAAPDGTLYAGGSSPGRELYRSMDGGESWMQLAPTGRDDPLAVSFQPIPEVQNWGTMATTRSGHHDYITDFGVDGEGNVIIFSIYSSNRVGVIDSESGAGRLRDYTFNERYSLPNLNERYVTRSGHIFVTGVLDDGDEYPSIVLRSTDGGESFEDITRGGAASFRGASWNNVYMLRDPEVEGTYSLNGARAGRALSEGMERSTNYWLYPNGLIGRTGGGLFRYSSDGGQTVETFRAPDDASIRSSDDYLYY